MMVALNILMMLYATLFFLAIVGGTLTSHRRQALRLSRTSKRKSQKKVSWSSAFLVMIFVIYSNSVNADQKNTRPIQMDVTYENHIGSLEAEFVIKAPVENVWSIIQDQEGMASYVPKMLYSRFVNESLAQSIQNSDPFKEITEKVSSNSKKTQSLGEGVHYLLQQFDFPWPLSNRWTLTEWINTSNPEKRNYTITYSLVKGTIKRASGGWTLKPDPTNSTWTIAKYTTESDIGFQAPAFIVKSATRKTTQEILEAIRNRAETMTMAKN